jgi:TolB-like protein/DNA-binding winged helix-turn-helix (wHTH) protein
MVLPAPASPQRYRFDDVILDPGQRKLWRGEETVRVTKLTFALLRVLVERAPNVVTYDELGAVVWGPRRYVTPESIAQRMKILRRILGDEAARPRYIESVRGQGYRLIPEVSTVASNPQAVREEPPVLLQPGSPHETVRAERDANGRSRSAALVARARAHAPALVLAAALAAVALYASWHGDAPTNAADRAPARGSIAVLPFRNLSPAPEDAYFAAGVHEQVISALAKVGELRVMARTSVMRYADADVPITQIAAELGVAAVLEGSVRYHDDAVRVTAQLIDGASGMQVWGDEYDGRLADIFAIQSAIALEIASSLEARLTAAERAGIEKLPTTSPEAYALYLRAWAAWDQDREAVERYLDLAIEKDPRFALAYASKAENYAQTITYSFGAPATRRDPDELDRLIREAAGRALELDPNATAALHALGIAHRYYWRWPEALAIYENLEVSRYTNAGAWFYSFIGDHEEAVRRAQRFLELNPGDPVALADLAMVLFNAKRAAGAADAWRRAVAVQPTHPGNHYLLAFAEIQLGNHATALRELRIAEELWTANQPLAGFAYCYGLLGERDDALRLFAELERRAAIDPVGAGDWVLAYLAIGAPEEALRWLRAAVEKVENREPDAAFFHLMFVRHNVFSDPLLERPEFVELRAKLGSWQR